MHQQQSSLLIDERIEAWVKQAITKLEPEVAAVLRRNYLRWGRNPADGGWIFVIYATQTEDIFVLKGQAEAIALKLKEATQLPIYLGVLRGEPSGPYKVELSLRA